MKNFIAITMTVLLLCSTMVLGVCAEGFVFREISREWNGDNLTVTWNQTEAAPEVEIEDILIGGKSYGEKLSLDAGGNLVIDLSSLPAGVYSSVTYEYVTAEKQGSFVSNTPLVKAGVVTVTLTAAFNADGSLVVTATDASGAPVANYSLKLTVGRMANISGTTDANGKYESPYTASEGESAVFEGVATEYQGVQYTAVQPAQITRPITATTTTPTTETTLSNEETTTTVEETTTVAETTTTENTTASTTQTSFIETLATIQGAGTTSKVDKQIALNISTDTGILGLFELKRAAFDNHARLLLSPENYEGLIGRTSHTLMLNVLSVEKQISYSTVQNAMKNSSFKKRSDEQWKPVTFNLSLLMLDRSGNTVPVTVAPENTQYTVQLPIPASLKDSSEWAITTFDGNELMAPQSLTVKDGILTFQTNSMGEYVIIGFPADANNKAGGISWRLTVLLIAGILLLGGAAFVLYWFVLRAPKTGKKKENVQKDTTPLIRVEPESDTDIFSGRTDIDIATKKTENDEQE